MRYCFGFLIVLAAACAKEDEGDYPVGGGGGGGGGNMLDGGATIDAVRGDAGLSDAVPSPLDAAQLIGRVCLANDPRKLNECATTGAGGLTVRLGTTATATTAADGRFTIAPSSGTWRVTGSNIVTSIMTLADYEIPAISRATYDAMITTNLGGLTLNPGEGSVMIQVIRNGVGLENATALGTPPSAWQPFYDNPASTTDWNQGGTGTSSNGAIWLAGLDVGTASVGVAANGTTITDSGVPVVDGAITFTTVIFP